MRMRVLFVYYLNGLWLDTTIINNIYDVNCGSMYIMFLKTEWTLDRDIFWVENK